MEGGLPKSVLNRQSDSTRRKINDTGRRAWYTTLVPILGRTFQVLCGKNGSVRRAGVAKSGRNDPGW